MLCSLRQRILGFGGHIHLETFSSVNITLSKHQAFPSLSWRLFLNQWTPTAGFRLPNWIWSHLIKQGTNSIRSNATTYTPALTSSDSKEHISFGRRRKCLFIKNKKRIRRIHPAAGHHLVDADNKNMMPTILPYATLESNSPKIHILSTGILWPEHLMRPIGCGSTLFSLHICIIKTSTLTAEFLLGLGVSLWENQPSYCVDNSLVIGESKSVSVDAEMGCSECTTGDMEWRYAFASSQPRTESLTKVHS